MEYAYFKTDKINSEQIITAWKKTQVEVDKITDKIKEKYKADTWYQRGDSILGFVLFGHGHEDKRGFNRTEMFQESKEYTVYQPNRRYKEGKAFNALVEKRLLVIEKHPDFSKYIINNLKLYRWICGPHSGSHTGQAIYNSGAGFRKGIVFVRVPISDDEPAPEEIPGFEKIKKSEFIAISEE